MTKPVRGTVTEEMVRVALAGYEISFADRGRSERMRLALGAALSSDGDRARLAEENEALRAVLGDKVVPYLLRQRRRPQRLLNTIREALSPAPEAKGTEER